MIDLRPHQTRTVEMLRSSLAGGHLRPMVKLPTGAGKTRLAAALIKMTLAKGRRAIFCVPAISLVDQTVRAFWDVGIQDVGVIQANHPLTDWSKPVQVASVQTMQRRSELPEAGLVIVDEAHVRNDHLWSLMASDAWRRIPVIGLSATPWAKGLGKVYDDLIIGATTQELIDAGYLSPFKVFAPSHPDLDDVKVTAGDYQQDQLGEAMTKPQLVADVVTTWCEKGEGRPTLCFAVNRAHAKALQDQFEAVGVPTGYVDAHSKMDERAQVERLFREGAIKVVCNVGVLTTGVDWDVRCLILARPTKSEMLYCLDSETEILTSHGWKGMGDVRVGDCVAACDGVNTKAGRWSNVTAVVQRPMTDAESWVEYSAPRANFRVTDKHRMIFRGALERGDGFRIAEASQMAACKGGAYLPTAVHFQQTGVPLTDDELYFIGMMMADGTWTSTAGSISQSERHPEIVKRIEACLQSCGIGYAKRRVEPNNSSGMHERFPRWRFSFSAGKPKPHGALGRPKFGNELKAPYEFVAGGTGYRHLLPYLDKDMAPALMQMSKPQFIKFLSGLWDGDGAKKLGVDYTPRSLEICSSRPMLMNRLQALCAINGMTANVRTENGASRSTPIHLITITDKDWRSCGGYSAKGKGPRPQIEVKPATNEMIWCVESEAGTIVTRRRGKVTVMGNCQIIGRALRPAPGKDHALILDHSDTTLRLGFVTDIDHDTLDDGRPKAKSESGRDKAPPLPKECPSCAFLKPARMYVCPACGHKPEARSDIEAVDGELVELGAKRAKAAKGEADAATKQRWYSGLLGICEERGYQRGWAANKYREKFGVWPKGLADYPVEPGPEIRSYVRHLQIKWAKSQQRRAANA